MPVLRSLYLVPRRVFIDQTVTSLWPGQPHRFPVSRGTGNLGRTGSFPWNGTDVPLRSVSRVYNPLAAARGNRWDWNRVDPTGWTAARELCSVPRIVCVAGAAPGYGRTSTAVNLSLVLSLAGNHTLLVDWTPGNDACRQLAIAAHAASSVVRSGSTRRDREHGTRRSEGEPLAICITGCTTRPRRSFRC